MELMELRRKNIFIEEEIIVELSRDLIEIERTIIVACF